MRRRWRGIFAGLSFGVFALVVLVIVRSFVVRDEIDWSRMSGPEPLSAEARKLLREQRGDDAGFITRRQSGTCALLRGRLLINWADSRSTAIGEPQQGYLDEAVNRSRRRWQWLSGPSENIMFNDTRAGILGTLGFDWHTKSTPPVQGWELSSGDVMFPLWPIALLTAIWPAVWLRRFLRDRHRRRSGLCVGCGYDLRGNPQGGCPECGMGAGEATIAV